MVVLSFVHSVEGAGGHIQEQSLLELEMRLVQYKGHSIQVNKFLIRQLIIYDGKGNQL